MQSVNTYNPVCTLKRLRVSTYIQAHKAKDTNPHSLALSPCPQLCAKLVASESVLQAGSDFLLFARAQPLLAWC